MIKHFSSDKLRGIMAERHITIDMLAAAVNRNRNTIQNWRNGDRIPNANDLENVSELLSVSKDYFYVEGGKPCKRKSKIKK